MQQTTLAIHLDNQPSLNNYYPANTYTQQVIDKLNQELSQPCQYYLLTGNSGCGKTHLLKAYCMQAYHRRCYIPCKQLARYQPNLLEGLTDHLICLDDIEYLLGNSSWEKALFRLFIQTKCTLLMSATTSEPAKKVLLPDLKSRLSACLHIKISPLNEQEQRQALAYRAQSRGMILSEKLLQWLQHNAPRSNHALFGLLNHLDQYCLMNQCKPSLSILQKLMGTLSKHHPDD